MFIDASALTALLTTRTRRVAAGAPAAGGTRLTSPLAVWESAIAVARVLDLSIGEAEQAGRRLSRPDGGHGGGSAAETARIALDAFDRFGKGRIGAAQFRGLLRLCLRAPTGPAADVQAPIFRRPISRP